MGVKDRWIGRRVRRVLACAVLVGAFGLAAHGGRAVAQGKDLADKSVTTLMDYAWAITPAKFTLPSGKEIVVDRNNRAAAMIPLDVARDVIKVGRLSANAQICDLREEQGANYQTLMAREQGKGKWNDQQLLYISQLHLLTVMMLTGKVNIVAKDGDDKDIIVEDKAKADAAARPAPTCSETERKKVGDQIKAYVEAEPAKK